MCYSAQIKNQSMLQAFAIFLEIKTPREKIFLSANHILLQSHCSGLLTYPQGKKIKISETIKNKKLVKLSLLTGDMIDYIEKNLRNLQNFKAKIFI